MTKLLPLSIFMLFACFLSRSSYAQDEIVSAYPWIDTVVDLDNCGGTTIKVYEAHGTSYVFVCDDHSNQMFSASGTPYCTSYDDFDCLDFYGFANPSLTWACNNSNANENQIFDDFPWLSNFVNPETCTDEDITVYSSGIYDYLVVETASSTIIYNDAGVQYCISRDDLDCLAFYGLAETSDNWSCQNSNESTCNPSDEYDLSWFDEINSVFLCGDRYTLFSGCFNDEPIFLFKSPVHPHFSDTTTI